MCRFLMIDEKSMLGLRQLHLLDSCLRQISPSSTQPFGRINVLLLGDFCQLPPVGERALYDTRRCIRRVVDAIAGQQLYQLFDKTIILTEIMCQQGQDETSLRFRELLSDRRDGIITQDDLPRIIVIFYQQELALISAIMNAASLKMPFVFIPWENKSWIIICLS